MRVGRNPEQLVDAEPPGLKTGALLAGRGTFSRRAAKVFSEEVYLEGEDQIRRDPVFEDVVVRRGLHGEFPHGAPGDVLDDVPARADAAPEGGVAGDLARADVGVVQTADVEGQAVAVAQVVDPVELDQREEDVFE